MKKEKAAKLSIKELVWYIIAGVAMFAGVFMIIFGIIGHHMGGNLDQNFIKQAEKNIVLDFRIWGIILLASGMLIAVIALVVFAKSADRNIERTIRRQQRLDASITEAMEIRPAVQTIEVESKPVEEKKPE